MICSDCKNEGALVECSECGEMVCGECVIVQNGVYYCSECWDDEDEDDWQEYQGERTVNLNVRDVRGYNSEM